MNHNRIHFVRLNRSFRCDNKFRRHNSSYDNRCFDGTLRRCGRTRVVSLILDRNIFEYQSAIDIGDVTGQTIGVFLKIHQNCIHRLIVMNPGNNEPWTISLAALVILALYSVPCPPFPFPNSLTLVEERTLASQ